MLMSYADCPMLMSYADFPMLMSHADFPMLMSHADFPMPMSLGLNHATATKAFIVHIVHRDTTPSWWAGAAETDFVEM